MTVQEAFAELGVDPGADVETIRRAYLRLIKERKPESDPDGFKRAREAFEVARASGEMEALVAASASDEAPSPAAPEIAGARAEPPPVDPFQPYLTAWKAIPTSTDVRQRRKIALEAREALPREPRAYWLVISTIDGRSLDVDLADAIRAGWQQGWPQFLEALLVRLPKHATRAEVEAALSSPRVSLRLLGATAAARWDAPRAASVIVEICEGILAAPPKGRPQAVPVERMLRVVLVLQEVRALAEASRAHAALRRCLQETGLELRLMSGPLGGVWVLAAEIAELPADFPPALRTAFALAALSGDMRSAFFDACFHVRHHGREVRKWVERLGTSVPNVVNTLRGAIQREAAAKKRPWRLSFGRVRWMFLIWPALMMLRFLVSGEGCSSDTERSRPALTTPAPTVGDPRLFMARAAARDLCTGAGPRAGQVVCTDIDTVLASLDESDCAEIPARVRAVKHKLSDFSASQMDARMVRNLELVAWDICRAQRSPAQEPGQ